MYVLHERVERQRAVPEVSEERAEPLRQRERDGVRRQVILLQNFKHYVRVRRVHFIATNKLHD